MIELAEVNTLKVGDLILRSYKDGFNYYPIVYIEHHALESFVVCELPEFYNVPLLSQSWQPTKRKMKVKRLEKQSKPTRVNFNMEEHRHLVV